MQISPINNINFNGKFKRTAELEKLLKISDQETLHRFNEVLERAGKVDDKMVFKISALSNFKFNKNAKTSTFHFHLLSYPESNEYKFVTRDSISFEHRHYLGKEELWKKQATVLRRFLPTLEKIYPKVNFESSTEEMCEKINSKLI